MTMLPLDKFGQQISNLQNRIEELQRRAGQTASAEITEALAELGASLEELQVAQEELRVAQEELNHHAELIAAAEAAALRDRRRYLDLFEQAPDGYLVTTRVGADHGSQPGSGKLAQPARRLAGATNPYSSISARAASARWHMRLLKLNALDAR